MLLSCQAGKSWIIKQQRRAKSLNNQEQLAGGNTERLLHGSIISKQYTENKGLNIVSTTDDLLSESGDEFQGLEHVLKSSILHSIFLSLDVTWLI